MKIRYFLGVLVMMSASGGWAGGDTAVNAAIEDLAGRLKVPAGEVAVISQTEKTWPDKSLGCPRKGMMYAQVLTNGSELVLEVAGKRYAYHAEGDKPYFYCAVPAKTSGTSSGTPAHDI
jgi:hypothetical protein